MCPTEMEFRNYPQSRLLVNSESTTSRIVLRPGFLLCSWTVAWVDPGVDSKAVVWLFYKDTYVYSALATPDLRKMCKLLRHVGWRRRVGCKLLLIPIELTQESTASLLVSSKLQRKVHGLLLCTLNHNFWWLDSQSLHFCMSIMQPF